MATRCRGWLGIAQFFNRGFDHALGNLTVPPKRGIFLSKTRRLHPDLCRFISDAFYDGRLMPEVGNERQGLVLDPNADPALAPTRSAVRLRRARGVLAEIRRRGQPVHQLNESLLGQRWTDREGRVRPIGVDDILVVSPYNMQVNSLRTRLPEGARVGTVDKFQGQEAAIVLVSMAISSVTTCLGKSNSSTHATG